MYRNTRFADLLKGLPRPVFEKFVDRFEADKHGKGFRAWDQLLALMYGQISGSTSLREIETGFNSQAAHHYHLGTRDIRRSTLADANQNRSSALFEAVCQHLMTQLGRRQRREVSDLLCLLDSTPIPLKGLGYDDWTGGNHNHRTQGLKIHVLIAEASWTPLEAVVTAPNVNDVTVGKQMPIEPGHTYVFDKGYCDYNWWHQIYEAGAFFVTRFKNNVGLKVIDSASVAESNDSPILSDEVVEFKNRRPGGQRINHYHGTPLRRVTVAREGGKPPLVLATNDMESPALVIAERYRQRWGIELFFKWLKQNLRIRAFLGRSENAVKTQIFTALITYLLLHIGNSLNGAHESLRDCLTELRAGLFQRMATEQELLRRRTRRRQEWQRQQAALPL